MAQSATQSSTLNNGDASRLTDGNKNPYFGNNSCSETDVANDVSWEVQLQDTIYITSVSITTRADPYWPYSDYFEIKLKDETANEYPSPCASGMLSNNGETMTYGCHTPYQGKGIRIVLPGIGKRLSLCEVEVHGRESAFFDNEGMARYCIFCYVFASFNCPKADVTRNGFLKTIFCATVVSFL